MGYSAPVASRETEAAGDSTGEGTLAVDQPTHWIIVGSPDNFARTRELGFTVHGIKSRHRRKAERMRPGDRIAFYVTGIKAFAATAIIKSSYFESHDRIWESGDPKKAAEDYPFRFEIAQDLVLDTGQAVPAEPIAREMAYARKWPPANWTLAFQGNVHVIGEADFDLIRSALLARLQRNETDDGPV